MIKSITVISGTGVNTYAIGDVVNGLKIESIMDNSVEFPDGFEFMYAGWSDDKRLVFELINAPVDIHHYYPEAPPSVEVESFTVGILEREVERLRAELEQALSRMERMRQINKRVGPIPYDECREIDSYFKDDKAIRKAPPMVNYGVAEEQALEQGGG